MRVELNTIKLQCEKVNGRYRILGNEAEALYNLEHRERKAEWKEIESFGICTPAYLKSIRMDTVFDFATIVEFCIEADYGSISDGYMDFLEVVKESEYEIYTNKIGDKYIQRFDDMIMIEEGANIKYHGGTV